MIVVLLGTNPYSFDRLIRPLDRLAGQKGWDVFVQMGNTTYSPEHLRHEAFVPRQELLAIVAQAEVVVCQGGFGSIRDALSLNKPIVAVPRQPELGESPDAQEELVRALENLGYVVGVYEIGDLEEAIERARQFVPEPRMASRIPVIIGKFLAEYVP
jgi:UDP-N-acetylglucosamine transferase subunit ALG13